MQLQTTMPPLSLINRPQKIDTVAHETKHYNPILSGICDTVTFDPFIRNLIGSSLHSYIAEPSFVKIVSIVLKLYR